jgi:undecaprenyl-diphosphatase
MLPAMVGTAEPVNALAVSAARRQTRQRPLLIAAGLAAALGVLAALVATGALVRRLDRSVLNAADPSRHWGPLQRLCSRFAEDLRPFHVMVVFAVVAVAIAVKRRSAFPLVLAAGCEAAVTLGVAALKAAVAARDPHHDLVGGGSFPSGHTAQMMVAFGAIALLFSGRLAAVLWAMTAIATIVMGAALLTEGAHWASDVIGGALLGGIILLLARTACIHWGGKRSLFAERPHKEVGLIE